MDQIQRVTLRNPAGSQFITAADAAAPGAAGLTGFAPTADLAATDVQGAVVESHRFNLVGAQTVLSLAITVLPTAGDTFTIAGEVFEFCDMTAVPPVATAGANIGLPLAAGAGALEATRLNTIAALNGTAGVTGIEDGAGNPAEPIAITSTFLPFRDAPRDLPGAFLLAPVRLADQASDHLARIAHGLADLVDLLVALVVPDVRLVGALVRLIDAALEQPVGHPARKDAGEDGQQDRRREGDVSRSVYRALHRRGHARGDAC
jgi:hypothetical protein